MGASSAVSLQIRVSVAPRGGVRWHDTVNGEGTVSRQALCIVARGRSRDLAVTFSSPASSPMEPVAIRTGQQSKEACPHKADLEERIARIRADHPQHPVLLIIAPQ